MKLKKISIGLGLFCSALSLCGGEGVKPFAVEEYGQIGAGGLVNFPVGSLKMNGKDTLFAFSSGCTMNKNIFHSYEKIGTVADGAPLFKKSLRLIPPNAKLDAHTRILKSRDGNIYLFFRTKEGIQRAVYDSSSGSFVKFGKALNLGWLAGIVENDDSSLFLYHARRNILKESEKHGVKAWNDKEPYFPFDGTLTWRGGESRSYILGTKLPSIDSDLPSENFQASTTREEAISLKGGDSFRDSAGNTHLFVGTREGITLHYIVGKDGKLSERQLCKTGNVAMRAPLIHNSPIVMVRDGKPDLLTGGEGGIYYYKFLKWEDDGTPVYERDLRARETDTDLYFGSLPVVEAHDWDGDGLTDIVIGNSQGQIAWAQNIGKSGEPKFLEPQLFKKEGEDFIQKGGYLNVQGPVEAQWGYVGPTLFDWDGDGKADLLTGDNSSHFGVYFNKGSPKNPNFTERKLLYCDGLEVHGTWRQRPGVAKLNNGKVAYVILDWDDQLRLYWQLDKFNLVDAGKLRLTDGNPINGTGARDGSAGRLKISLVDVDSDGKTDLLLGTIGANRVPNFERGVPGSLKKRGAQVLWLRNVGDDSQPVFEYPKIMSFKNPPQDLAEAHPYRHFGFHSCSADLVDFGGDMKGILVGMEDGNIMLCKFSDIEWKDFNSLERAVRKGEGKNSKKNQ